MHKEDKGMPEADNSVSAAAGAYNWRLTFRRENGGVTILRAVTCDGRAALPERVAGLPVLALGDHALAPGARETAGETLTVTAAPSDRAWDNRALRELTLPPSLRVIGDYALLNCTGLTTLRFHDAPIRWGTGVLMNCRALGRLVLTRTAGTEGDSLARLAGELSRELDVSVTEDGTERLRLLFPAYFEEYEENGPAHHFDYKVYGAGQPYRQAFRDRRLSLYDYDALWPRYLAGEHDPDAALRLARYRLDRPEGLTDEAAARYERYLTARAAEALRQLLEEDREALYRFLRRVPCGAEALRGALALAREKADAAASALLLEELRRRGGTRKRWEL